MQKQEAKKAYTSPKLDKLGTVGKLTLGGKESAPGDGESTVTGPVA